MAKGFIAAVFLAAGLAGCGGGMTNTPYDTRTDKEGHLPPGEGMFGSAFSAEWVRRDPGAKPEAPAMTAAEQEDFKKWQESATPEQRKEFEDWRAWQEQQKKNPK